MIIGLQYGYLISAGSFTLLIMRSLVWISNPLPGYLDNTLSIFERHNHPFILVGILAMQWSGSNAMANKETDVLLKPSEVPPIANELISIKRVGVSPA